MTMTDEYYGEDTPLVKCWKCKHEWKLDMSKFPTPAKKGECAVYTKCPKCKHIIPGLPIARGMPMWMGCLDCDHKWRVPRSQWGQIFCPKCGSSAIAPPEYYYAMKDMGIRGTSSKRTLGEMMGRSE
jgi:hypothetical protein